MKNYLGAVCITYSAVVQQKQKQEFLGVWLFMVYINEAVCNYNGFTKSCKEPKTVVSISCHKMLKITHIL